MFGLGERSTTWQLSQKTECVLMHTDAEPNFDRKLLTVNRHLSLSQILRLAMNGGKCVVHPPLKVHTLDIAPLRSESLPQKPRVRHGFLRDRTVLPAHPHVHPQPE